MTHKLTNDGLTNDPSDRRTPIIDCGPALFPAAVRGAKPMLGVSSLLAGIVLVLTKLCPGKKIQYQLDEPRDPTSP